MVVVIIIITLLSDFSSLNWNYVNLVGLPLMLWGSLCCSEILTGRYIYLISKE